MTRIYSYHLILFVILCRNGVKCWRNLERGNDEDDQQAAEVINTNIQSRAASSFLWSPPPIMNNVVNQQGDGDDVVETNDESTARRPVRVRQCTQTLERAGLYKVRGSFSIASFCYVMIKAPALQRIRITLRNVVVGCQRSGLMLFDGWMLLDRKRPSVLDSIPLADDDAGGDENVRKVYICTDNAGLYRSLETSQNIGQILYVLRSGDEFTFQIDFLPDNNNQACGVYISRDDEPISLNLRVDQPRNCRVYVSGAARLRFTTLQLDEPAAGRRTLSDNPTTCGNSGSNYVSVQANSTSWNPNLVRRRFYHCDSDLSEFNTPCRFNVIELHSVIFVTQSATLEIDPLPDEDREPWSYYCY